MYENDYCFMNIWYKSFINWIKKFLKYYYCCCIGDVVYEIGSYGGYLEDEKNGYC